MLETVLGVGRWRNKTRCPTGSLAGQALQMDKHNMVCDECKPLAFGLTMPDDLSHAPLFPKTPSLRLSPCPCLVQIPFSAHTPSHNASTSTQPPPSSPKPKPLWAHPVALPGAEGNHKGKKNSSRGFEKKPESETLNTISLSPQSE